MKARPYRLFILALSLVVIGACGQNNDAVVALVGSGQSSEGEALKIDDMEIAVSLDVRPASCPNPLNPRSRGVLPVAILGTADFNVSDIDVASIRLLGVSPVRSRINDVATPLISMPNLRVVDFTGPANARVGGQVGYRMSLTLENSGPVDVNDYFFIGYYISADSVITTRDRLLIGGRESLPGLGAHTQRGAPLWPGMFVSFDAPTGDVYLGAIVDEFDRIAEEDETDNTASVPIRIDSQSVPGTEVLLDLEIRMAATATEEECVCTTEGPDGFDDMSLKFSTREIVAALGDVSAGDIVSLTITGQTFDGSTFVGDDCVVIVGQNILPLLFNQSE